MKDLVSGSPPHQPTKPSQGAIACDACTGKKTDVNREAVGCFLLLLLLISLAILEAEIGWRSKRQLDGCPS